MLILRRRSKEAIIIAEALRLELAEVCDTHVTISLSGPPEVMEEPYVGRLDAGEEITLGADSAVTVKVCAIDPVGVVKLGFTADRHIPIDREEVHLRKQESSTN